MWQILGNKVFLAVAGAFCAALISALLYAINLRGQIADLREDNADLRENLTLAISQSEISKANLDACAAKIELQNAKFKEPNLLRRVKFDSPFLKSITSNLTSNLLAKNYVKTKKYLLNLTPRAHKFNSANLPFTICGKFY